MGNSKLKERGFHALLWDIIGKVAINASSFIVTIVLTRLLTPTDFGELALVMVIIGIASVFIDTGLGGALIQRKRVLPIHYSSVFYFNLTIGFLLTLISFFLAPFISEFYNNPALVPLMRVISFLFFFNSLSPVQTILLRKALNNKALTKIGLTASISSGIIGIIFALLGAGVWSLVIQVFMYRIVYNLVIWKQSTWRPSGFSLKALKQLWGFGFRMFIVAFIDTIFSRLDFIIIGKLFSLQILGYFERAKSLNAVIIKYTSDSLTSVLFPVLSSIQSDIPRLTSTIFKSINILSFFIFLFLGGLYLISEELILFLFSDTWIHTVNYFKLLILSGFVYPIGALLISVLTSRGKSKKVLRLVIYRTFFLSLNFLIGFYYGIEEYLYGLIFISIINISLYIYYVTQELPISFMQLAKPILIQGVISVFSIIVILYMVNYLLLSGFISFLFKGILFLTIYIGLNYFLKIDSFKYTLVQITPLLNKYKLIKLNNPISRIIFTYFNK